MHFCAADISHTDFMMSRLRIVFSPIPQQMNSRCPVSLYCTRLEIHGQLLQAALLLQESLSRNFVFLCLQIPVFDED